MFVYLSLAIAGLLIGIDQWIKHLALTHLEPIGTYPIVKDILHLTFVENRGAAFGILQDKKWFLIGLTGIVLVTAVVLLLLKKFQSRLLIASVALVIAGGFGNLIDRIFRGYVIDYIDFRVINFAVFNFADCCVVVGTIFILIYFWFIDGKSTEKRKIDE